MSSIAERGARRSSAGGLEDAARATPPEVQWDHGEDHLLRVFTKLDVSDRTAAVTTTLAHGLL
ncbi:hypothetical protein ACWEQG_25510 [Microbispora sp. NPDC004025]